MLTLDSTSPSAVPTTRDWSSAGLSVYRLPLDSRLNGQVP